MNMVLKLPLLLVASLLIGIGLLMTFRRGRNVLQRLAPIILKNIHVCTMRILSALLSGSRFIGVSIKKFLKEHWIKIEKVGRGPKVGFGMAICFILFVCLIRFGVAFFAPTTTENGPSQQAGPPTVPAVVVETHVPQTTLNLTSLFGSSWAWVAALIFLPILGWLVYETAQATPHKGRLRVLTMLAIIIAASFVLLGIWPFLGGWVSKDPTFASIGAFFQDYWLRIVVIWLVSYTLLGLLGSKTLASRLQFALITGIVLCLCATLWTWFWTPNVSIVERQERDQAIAICPNVSADETSSCLIGSNWSSGIRFTNGARDNGKHPCFYPAVEFRRWQDGEWTYWSLRSSQGKILVNYRLFSPPDDACPSTL